MASVTQAQPKRGWSETLKNYWLDFALLIMFIVDMNTAFTGITLHEWLGVIFGVALIYHLLLHWKWITSVSTRLFSPKLPTMQRVRYALNWLLFIAMVVVVASGLFISEAFLPFFGFEFENGRRFFQLHHVSSELTVLLIALHLAFDLKWIVENTKKYMFGKSRA